jgi:uncharacterized membrane protein
MKIQDLLFFLVFIFVLWRGSAKLATIIGIFCLGLAAFLFKFWVFFTAERLVCYSAAFFLYSIIRQIYENRH